jgi:DNA polymerase-3 subunit alpha
MEDRDPVLDKRPFHLLLLAKDMTGYRNLLKIASESQLRGYYYRPRIDWDFLHAHREGLVVTSGCLAARIPRLVVEGRDAEAREWIGRFQETFGADNFYLELQQHDIPDIKVLNRWLIDYRRSGHSPVGLLATNDVHYVRPEDFEVHDTLLCIQTSALKSAPKRKDHDNEEGTRTRMGMSDNSYYLTSYDELAQTWAEVPEALSNSLKIAEMCNVSLDDKEYHLPVFPVPPGHTAQTYLRRLCEMGLEWRYGSRASDPELVERLDYELGVINNMGFDTYFLIVWDLTQYAAHADIWWNVRGSGAGSLAAYCLGITMVDPIQNSLLFERFLNPGRVSMPDIDIDFPDDRRGEMIAYTARKYGEDKVAAIITFGTLGAKASIKDVARVYDVPLTKVNEVAALIPTEAKQKSIEAYIEANPDLQAIYHHDPQMREVMDMAKELQGVHRHTSVHAAGVIVADRPLAEYLPLARVTGKDPSNGALKAVTQFPMETCEKIGLLKVDFLGLSTLTILRKACDLIREYHGVEYNLWNIPYRHDDPKITEEQRQMLNRAFEMMGHGDTIGVFQLESSGMQQMLRDMRPQRFENIVAGVALYRPGPMEFIPTYNRRLHGEETPTYLHPKLEPILSETYGIIVYQESIMQIGRELFGYQLGEADLMRKAVSKKKDKDLAEHRAIFVERGPDYGVDAATADSIFNEIEYFANYGFNRAHATDYAVVTVQTAFLKANYPEEYLTAMLSVQRDDADKVSVFLAECRRLNIPILPPDVNYSGIDFTIQVIDGQRAIRYGLVAIKNAGEGALLPIVAARDEGGRFSGLQDFCERVDLRQVGKRALESLIMVGALRELHHDRAALLENVDRLLSYSGDFHKDREVGQMNMFGGIESTGMAFGTLPPALNPVSLRDQLRWEKELLGQYVSGRPADKFRDVLAQLQTQEVAILKQEDVAPTFNEKNVQVAGEIVEMRKVFTRKNDAMSILKIEDWHDTAATIEVVLFPRTWNKLQALVESGEIPPIETGEIFLVRGKFDFSRGDAQIIGDHLTQQFDLMSAADMNGTPVPLRPAALPAALPADDPYVPPDVNGYGLPDEPEFAPPRDDGDDPGYIPPQDWDPAPAEGSAPAVNGGYGTNGHAGQRTPHPDYEPVNGWALHHDEDADTRDDVSEPVRMLVVRLPRHSDEARNLRVFNRVYGLIVEKPGRDRFAFIITDDEGEYVAEFDKPVIDCSDALLDELARIVGADNIEIRQVQDTP